MKKIYSLLCTALLLMGLTACEDVPAPYEINEDGPTDSKVLLSETFASSLGKFQNITADGAIEWVNSYSCATATGYDNSTKTNIAGVCYLVSPEVDLTEVDSAHVSYDYILRYRDQDDYQKLLIIDSESYNAVEIENCPWTTVFNSHEEGSDYTTFAKADVNVPDSFYGKKVRLALRFQAGAKSATWEVKNFKVQRGVAGGDDPVVEDGIFVKSFSSDLSPFTNYTTSGSGEWIIDYSTAKATGYDNASKVTTAGTYYLVSPAISLADVEKAYVDYNYILRYNKGNANQQLLISTSFDAANPTAGWTVLNENHTEGTDWATFANTAVQIPEEYIGQTIYLAFKYNTDDKSGSTWEVKNIAVKEGEATDKPNPGPIGGGTADDPLTVAELQALFDANTIPSEKVYVKGIVSEVKEVSADYGNATYFISDDGTAAGQFEVYRGYALNGDKFKSADQLQVGDEVIVYGQVALYNKTREFTTGSQLYYSSRLGQGGYKPTPGPAGDPKGTGTATDPYNIAAVLKLFADNNIPTSEIYFKGIVSKVKEVSPDYGNATYYVSDDGKSGNDFYVYRSKYLNGEQFTNANQIMVGDTVIVCGKVTLYNTTPETEQNASYLYWTSNNGTTPTPPGPTPDPVNLDDFKNGDFETWANGLPTYWKTASTAGNATLAQSTDAHSGSYSVLVKTGGSANKRLGYQEMTLAAGKYAISFYAKGAEGNDAASVRPGYVPIKDDGSVGSYAYGDYTNDITSSEWVPVTHTFELTATTTLCLVIMNPKNCGDVLIDDFTIGTVSSAKKRK